VSYGWQANAKVVHRLVHRSAKREGGSTAVRRWTVRQWRRVSFPISSVNRAAVALWVNRSARAHARAVSSVGEIPHGYANPANCLPARAGMPPRFRSPWHLTFRLCPRSSAPGGASPAHGSRQEHLEPAAEIRSASATGSRICEASSRNAVPVRVAANAGSATKSSMSLCKSTGPCTCASICESSTRTVGWVPS
jgi:hypothetical protein